MRPLDQLGTDYLKDKPNHHPKASGGDRREDWPVEAINFLKSFLPVPSPLNYQLVAEEMERLCNFKRARATVESYVKTISYTWFPLPLPRSAPIGELWVLEHSPKLTWPPVLGHFTLKSAWLCSGEKFSFEPVPTKIQNSIDGEMPGE